MIRDMHPEELHLLRDFLYDAISVLKEYRGQGIGTALMKAMLEHLREAGYKRASLSVQKANYAVKMYMKLGFGIFSENDGEYIMLVTLT